MTKEEIIAALASMSEEDCKAIRGAAGLRANTLAMAREKANEKEVFARFAALPLGTKIRYVQTDAENRIASRLGFAQSEEWELRLVRGGCHHLKGIWLCKRFNDDPKSWRFVRTSQLVSTRWVAVTEEKTS